MRQGNLIAVNGKLYEYHGYDEQSKVHIVHEANIDEEGIVAVTYNMCYFYPKQLAEGINKIQLTQKQWIGIVKYLLSNDYLWSKVLYNLTEEEINEAAEEIVLREFAILGVPTVEELSQRIETYMNR